MGNGLEEKRDVVICERNSPADIKVSAEGKGESAPQIGIELPLQAVVQTMARQIVPLYAMEVQKRTEFYRQHMEKPSTGAGGYPKDICDPMGIPQWSRFLVGPMDPWRKEPMLKQVSW
ncbi:protein pxr1-like [Willisornis vidua]|uniref:Protein pxr1-like n=1 Tax=Willisornis vidua TaxID=1566151 RepID=A0ABQ9CYA8_9PASS|nr:protein pxr1-like [Willisornis vidua]